MKRAKNLLPFVLLAGAALLVSGCAVDALFGSGDRGEDDKRGGGGMGVQISVNGTIEYVKDGSFESDGNPFGHVPCSFEHDGMAYDGKKITGSAKGKSSHMGNVRFEVQEQCTDAATGLYRGRGVYINSVGDYLIVDYKGKIDGSTFTREEVARGGSGKLLGATGTLSGAGQLKGASNDRVEWAAQVTGILSVQGR
jgi:hypothetical protein